MQVQVGVRVRVPFGKRELIGIVWQLDPENAHPDKLKALLEVLDQTPLFGNEIKQLLSFAADYYHHPLGEVLVSALPALLREGKAVLAGHGRLLQLTPLGSSLKTDVLQRAPRQLALWQRLQQAACREDELVGESPQIKALLEKDLVAWQAIEFSPFVPQPDRQTTITAQSGAGVGSQRHQSVGRQFQPVFAGRCYRLR